MTQVNFSYTVKVIRRGQETDLHFFASSEDDAKTQASDEPGVTRVISASRGD